MTKVKTSGLSRMALNWAVATCEGYQPVYTNPLKANTPLFRPNCAVVSLTDLNYSTDWALGGLIIERELIKNVPPNYIGTDWTSRIRRIENEIIAWYCGFGSTPLISAMRCYVAYKLGNEIEIPNVLIGK